jgi:hypothetical protein
MRRFVCVIALLAGFSGQGYAWTMRPRLPIPIERPVAPATRGQTRGFVPTLEWWRR